MHKTVKAERDNPRLQPSLFISVERVCFVVAKARELDAKEPFLEVDPASNPLDDSEIDGLVGRLDDPDVQELRDFIDDLSEDEQVDLVALAWLGRDGGDLGDWADTREEAARLHDQRTMTYFLSLPQLGDRLEEGLGALGYSCEDFELG